MTINGTTALKRPAHIPWQNLINIYTLNPAKKRRIPKIKANPLIISKEFLNS